MATTAVSLNEINARVANLAVVLRNTLSEVRTVKTQLVDVRGGASTLVSLGQLQAVADEQIFTILDLDKLARIAIGQDVQADPSDFFFHARNVIGLA